jgi:hypothetical protein
LGGSEADTDFSYVANLIFLLRRNSEFQISVLASVEVRVIE